jgi:hypothetical protein
MLLAAGLVDGIKKNSKAATCPFAKGENVKDLPCIMD